ncbi:MAG: DUF177 domain-containing protein [Clostridia bacterium]|nr:DUF177 domain-containing protein [Clostridia bacterium]
MKLDLRPLLAENIRILPVDFLLPPPAEEDMAPNLYGVRFPSDLQVQGEITNTAGYMRMSLSAAIPYIAPCARCLEDVTGTFSFRFEKTVAPAKLLTNIAEEDADDYVIVEDGFLDVDEQLLEMLTLEFPSKLLCREDCAGLCPQCGKSLNEGPCQCSKQETDPRLAPLAAWLERHKADKSEDET